MKALHCRLDIHFSDQQRILQTPAEGKARLKAQLSLQHTTPCSLDMTVSNVQTQDDTTATSRYMSGLQLGQPGIPHDWVCTATVTSLHLLTKATQTCLKRTWIHALAMQLSIQDAQRSC